MSIHSTYAEHVADQFVSLAHSFVDEDPRRAVRVDGIDDGRLAVIVDGEAIDSVQQRVENTIAQLVLIEIDDVFQHDVD